VLLVERRTEATLALTSSAITRDMKGAHVSMLLPIVPEDVADPPHDLHDSVARGFARFPYPESFFVWRAGEGEGEGRAWFFNRSDRTPPWWREAKREEPYPVTMVRDPASGRALVAAARAAARDGRRFVVFEWRAEDTPYQVLVQVLPHGAGEPMTLAAFTVNLRWVRERYFKDLLREVARIAGTGDALALAVLDDHGRTLAETAPLPRGALVRDRPFPVLFFDPAMLSLLSPGAERAARWTARVGVANDETLAAATRGARRTFFLLTAAATAAVIGMLVTARAVRVRAELAAMKSDFVSTVTHELKTPLALIRLVGDTLSMGRYSSPDTIRDYARLLSQEGHRLTRLVDNLLTYARVTDVHARYCFEPLELEELVEDALDRFHPRLAETGFVVAVEVPDDLPRIRADRTALLQALDNLVDNAIKYSGDRRSLAIRGQPAGAFVRLEVADRGHGIAAEDIGRVFEKFFRARGAKAGGSGLGLAIVRRVMADHGGTVSIASPPGEGTTVRLTLPVAGA
jgi:two-component system phosphate regulon sensor histidine kinase PhoR